MGTSNFDPVDFFQRVFTVVLALALGEAVKQFTADKASSEDDRTIHWERLPALVSTIILIIPFYHGMNRYLYGAYRHSYLSDSYAFSLFFDSMVFTIDSVLFFIMARMLSPALWQKLTITLCLLLAVDAVWSLFAQRRVPEVFEYFIQDIVFATILVLLLLAARKSTKHIYWSVVVMILSVCKTAYDYTSLWDFYFPDNPSGENATPPPSAATPSAPSRIILR